MTKATKKVKTGHCGIGNHEGTKPVSYSGKPMPICTFWDTCSCECHEQITQMYKLTGLDREPPEQNLAYLEWTRSERSKFHMPEAYDGTVSGLLSNVGAPDAHPGNERPSTGTLDPATDPLAAPVRPRDVPVFMPTPTGRRARGQLEYDVLAVCTDYANAVFDWEFCTPKLVAEKIGKKYAVEPPSTGAINAVWDRWEKLGFAVQDKKPSRFVKFNYPATIAQLELMKNQQKRAKKRATAAAKRDPLASRRAN